MDYQYSTVIDNATWDSEGLCEGIDLRQHNYTYFEDRGAIRAHEDWTKFISPVTGYRGTLGPRFSFMSVAVPECIPERLEIVAYANEFAFLHDDVTDNVSQREGEVENDDMMEAFHEGSLRGTININDPNTKRMNKKKIQAQLLNEMIAIDPKCALITMKAWAKFVEVGSSRQHHTVFTKLDDYLPYRIMDVGEMFWYGVVTFGMGIVIPEEETEICRELMRPAWIAVGLQNDLYSWEKEKQAADRNGHTHVVNAIWVLMREYNISDEDAKILCRKMIKDWVAKYIQIVRENKHNQSLSIDLRKYIEAMQYSISGNVAWSLACPRYNPTASFNRAQLEWMQNGIPNINDSNTSHESATHSPKKVTYDDSSASSISTQESRIGLNQTQNSPHSSFSSPAPSLRAECLSIFGIIPEENLPALGTEATPFDYLCSLPSKNVREQFIDALNQWVKVPPLLLEKVKAVAQLLHNASLLLDDFQDSSPLRRGRPSTHTIFGPAQTINSSSYCIIRALDLVRTFPESSALGFVIEKLLLLFVGQSYDLHWSFNATQPSMPQYLQMIDSKTGALFQLLSLLMSANATVNKDTNLDTLSILLGRYFQIRDDYQNLKSSEYTSQKGFCEDLDEGKYSLPLLHLLQAEIENVQISNILSTRRTNGKMTYEQKVLMLEHFKEAGSLEFTAAVLESLYEEICGEIARLEKACGENTHLKILAELLRL
ncbi:related to Fusicoccadiene synthase [Rhynchosporium secalis]|uniref:Related to Fusicoccadiene synthase n=1 Tax=Rhynchosporium secalis TaxID=38038 RepID=A0A1E1MK23_RHYSE|nr:related to Fusicoccadiene synthase [Rhynchosporium secalis]